MNKRLAAGVVVACLLAAAVCSCASRAGPEVSDANRTPPSAAESAGGAAPAGTLDFTLVNFTGATLRAVYVSPVGSEGWEENVLGRDGLLNGDTVEIGFSPEERAVRWDLRVEDDLGSSAEWKDLNLREISRLTLRLDKERDVVVAKAE